LIMTGTWYTGHFAIFDNLSSSAGVGISSAAHGLSGSSGCALRFFVGVRGTLGPAVSRRSSRDRAGFGFGVDRFHPRSTGAVLRFDGVRGVRGVLGLGIADDSMLMRAGES
jgi:hypothetical protein